MELEAFGVRDLTSWKEFQEIRSLLFFPVLPTKESVAKRVERLGEIALAEAKEIWRNYRSGQLPAMDDALAVCRAGLSRAHTSRKLHQKNQ
ncbi:hypothetical protein AB6846_22300 [Serratia proteamaculans]